MVNNKIFIHELFLGMQDEMKIALLYAKRNIKHPVTQGDYNEYSWIQMLKEYIPKRYQVEKAYVVDSSGDRSDQIDIIIFDRQYSPFLLNKNGALYIPAESVYATIEVKPLLNKKNIEYAGNKAYSVKRLFRTNAPIQHVGGIYPPRKLFPILAGILTLDSDWNPTFGKSFITAVSSLKKGHEIDIGCVLNKGAFTIYSKKKKREIKTSRPEHALIFFFLTLLDKLQSLATVPAIEMDKYWSIIK